MKSFMTEFKEFISRGSVMDMAVGIIIGSAFTGIVNSLVNDVIMPLIGVVIGGLDFSALSIVVGEATINYGLFIQNIVNFLIVAFCVFSVIKAINKMRDAVKKPEEEKEEEPEEDPADIALLKEIRDLLQK
ncbi:MAG: large-conductance mechanosensitive channel protein MscL [Clostridiales bacterium]|nr:large-conductance mechanosensitive channel protein MscL [Candidatus Crickella merdequi]